jgi:hypothetical protein
VGVPEAPRTVRERERVLRAVLPERPRAKREELLFLPPCEVVTRGVVAEPGTLLSSSSPSRDASPPPPPRRGAASIVASLPGVLTGVVRGWGGG